MADENWQQLRKIFDDALRQSGEERRKFVERACGGDEILLAEVESLLSSFESAESFMETPAVARVADQFLPENRQFTNGQFLNHYEIIERIGAGGMGEVYLALDSKLNRKVAIKVLHQNLSLDNQTNPRLLREAQAAALLDHPNICSIYEIAETDVCSFIVMQYVEGETLAERLAKERLSTENSLDWAIQIADALAGAHSRGIIHRDIKPANIIINEKGQAKVLDFGLAKFIEAETNQETTNRHSSGAVMGTAVYMSPEQARGIEVDARTDLWSLGVVVYELLSGQKPFAGETTTDILASVLREEPLPLSAHLENVPAELEWIISKTLSKKLEGRYQTADELRADLEKIKRLIEYDEDSHRSLGGSFKDVKDKNQTAGIPGDSTQGNDAETTNGDKKTADEKYFASVSSVEYVFKQARTHKTGALFGGLLVFSILLYAAYYFFNAQPDTGKIDSIAVLPFENLSQDKDLAYLADGVSENLINRLSRLPQLKVISRNSSFKFRDSKEDLPAVASKLNVRAIVTGSVSQIGDELIIKYEIVDAAENRLLSGEQFRRKAGDLLKIQNEISRDIANQLNLKLTDSQAKRIDDNGTDNPEAFRYYLSGLVELSGPQNILGRALEYFQKAVELDPNFAEARIEIASIYWQRANASGNPKQLMPKVEEETEKALAINPNLAKARVMLASLKEYEFDWQSAEQEYLRAIELNPNLDFTRNNYAFFLSVLGRYDEASAQLDELKQRDPINVRQFLTTRGIILAWARKFDESIREFQKIQAVEQTVKVEDFSLGYVYGGKRMYKTAAEHFKQAVEIVGGDEEYSLALVFLAASYAKMPEKKAEARSILARLENMSGYVSPATIAIVYAALDENDKALESLEKAYLERDVQLRFIGVGYEYDNLRQDPRFADLAKRIGLRR